MPGITDVFIPTAVGLAPAISYLGHLKVSSGLLGNLLDETPENIRQIVSRFRRSQKKLTPTPVLPEIVTLTPEQREEWHLAKTDFPKYYGKDKERLERLERQIQSGFEHYANNADFSAGIQWMRPKLGNVAHVTNLRTIRIKAKIYQHIAWFSTHLGLSTAARNHARESMDLCAIASGQSLDPYDLNRYVEAALIRSNACLLSMKPNAAIQLLDKADAAAVAAANPPGSEHYRQRANAMAHLGFDDIASKLWSKARRRMEEKYEARNPADLKLLSPPQSYEDALTIKSEVEPAFGNTSLEFAMILNRTATAGLMTGSTTISEDSRKLLIENWPVLSRFGKEATVATLLKITPDLGLSAEDQANWLKFAARQNAFSKH